MRGAPGNTVCHPTSYFVGKHSPRVFVEEVDMVCGVGTNRRAFEIRRVITNLGVFDFGGPSGAMRLRSLHPGVAFSEVEAATGFAIEVDGEIQWSRGPTAEEADWLERLDPGRAIRGTVD